VFVFLTITKQVRPVIAGCFGGAYLLSHVRTMLDGTYHWLGESLAFSSLSINTKDPCSLISYLTLSPIHFNKHLFFCFSLSITHRWRYITGWVTHSLSNSPFSLQFSKGVKKGAKMVGAIKAAIGDGVLTFMWVFCSSVLGIASGYVTKALNLQDISYNGFPYPAFIVTITLVFVLVFLFTLIGNALGGASFNPTGTASFYAVGLGSDTLFSMAIRFPAQVRGFPFVSKRVFYFSLFSRYGVASKIEFIGAVILDPELKFCFFFFFLKK